MFGYAQVPARNWYLLAEGTLGAAAAYMTGRVLRFIFVRNWDQP